MVPGQRKQRAERGVSTPLNALRLSGALTGQNVKSDMVGE